MCAIAGLLSADAPVPIDLLRAMTAPMAPRGPDSAGEWRSDDPIVGFGHRRLAILDLSDAGHQPMTSACGRFTITFNGEIYNCLDIRRELEGLGLAPAWRGHSDTEILLAAIAAWGVVGALRKCTGMFAFGMWDHARRELMLARDRFGEKPLYYGWIGGRFAFASTLAGLRALPGFTAEIDRAALATMLSRSYVPAPRSIYAGIFKLPAGSLLAVRPEAARTPLRQPPMAGDGGEGALVRMQRYFDYADQVLAGAGNPFDDPDSATDAVERALVQSVSRQLVADVSVGVLLSGGIDSSLVTAMACQASTAPVKTFSLGFDEERFDEAGHAQKVAQALGTEHHCVHISAAAARAIIPALPAMYDEPFADNSQIPTHIVSAMARQSVTVALTGDGGDELFGGYPRYWQLPGMWRKSRLVPQPLRTPLLAAGARVPARAWMAMARLAGMNRSPRFGENARNSLRLLADSPDFASALDRLQDMWAGHASPIAGGTENPIEQGVDHRLAASSLEAQMMHADAIGYLTDDILVKVDRAAMATSLETRVPMLDPDVTATAARIPVAWNFEGRSGKAILKRLLYRHVPRELVDRPKAGFGIPVGEWLRTDLRSWAEDLLAPDALAADGLLDPVVIRQRWSDHLAGREDAAQPLWNVLMFQAWRRQ